MPVESPSMSRVRSLSPSASHQIPITPENKKNLMIKAKQGSRLQTPEEHRVLSIIKVVTKFTVLVAVESGTSILMIMLGMALPAAAISIDGVINGFCALYCFKMYEKRYCRCCGFFHWGAFRLCVCCLFETIGEAAEKVNTQEQENTNEIEIVGDEDQDKNNIDNEIHQAKLKRQETRRQKMQRFRLLKAAFTIGSPKFKPRQNSDAKEMEKIEI